jgi:putative DNA primase/helicase
MEVLCYHAILSTDPSPASLFRSIDLFKPTLLIDENQIMDEDVRAILASGYRYSGKVMRVIDPEADDFNSVKIFNTFAFIIYASKEEPPSDILSRSVVINCMKNLNQIRKRIDEVKVIELRTRWLAQKLRYLDRVTVTYDEFVSDNGRLQDIISPLKAMATLFGGEEAAAAIERYGRKIEAEIKALEASEPEAELVEEVARIYEERKGDAPEVIYTHELHERLKDRGWTPQLIGRRMTALGFKRYSGPGKRGYLIDPKLLTNLKIRYGLFQGRLPQT